MRLTTKGRFAVTAMIDLAMRQHNGPVTLSEISSRQDISLSYLEQLFGKLRRVNIVQSTRGPGGGYSLSREDKLISIAEIITAVDEPIDATQCGNKGNCQSKRGHLGECMTHELWSNLNKKMVDYLQSVTLNDVVKAQKDKDSHVPMFVKTNPRVSPDEIEKRQEVIDNKRKKIAEAENKPFIANSVFNFAQQT
ncbi:Rrf2 family transcriptional regulator [Polynucleobacter rarus]|jgi:Rrf2 family transcriptional regulator, iron-sulfur cluster assembly transcription factor|uniref:Rrf2 family transcriptional regulator n=1 Tax=Polynucleobacter rarus TaxID=556055 RepID=UPI000D3E1DBE|nr:Rrf2 family transcriptional regulator [Polynucleobacter rarus]